MSANKLPHVNLSGPASADRVRRFQSDLDKNLRRLATHGSSYGIIPVPGDDAATSLQLALATRGPTLDILPGSCYTRSGVPVTVVNAVTGVALPSLEIGSCFVVYLRHTLIDEPGVIVDTYNEAQSPGRIQAPVEDMIQISTLLTFVTDGLDKHEDVVPLGDVMVAEVDGNATLIIDPARRPYYSHVDFEHRNLTGSGKSSTSNPHGIGLADLSDGDHSIYALLAEGSVVIAPDDTIPGVAGIPCAEELPAGSFFTDNDGTVTGIAGAQYAYLSKIPTRLGGCFANGDEVPAILVPGTNIVAFPLPGTLNDCKVIHSTTTAGLVTAIGGQPPTSTIQISQPSEGQLILAGHKAHTKLSDTVHTFTDVAAFPRKYTLVVGESGCVHRLPQAVLCTSMLSDMGSAVHPPTHPMLGNAYLSVGMARAIAGPSLNVRVRLTGTNQDGDPISETLILDNTWGDTAIPSTSFTPQQYAVTSQPFNTLDGIQVLERSAEGPNARIAVWAHVTARDTAQIRHAAPLCELHWDGVQIQNMNDTRDIRLDATTPTATPNMHNVDEERCALIISDTFRHPTVSRFDLQEDRVVTVNDLASPVLDSPARWTSSAYGSYRSRFIPANSLIGSETVECYLYPVPNGRFAVSGAGVPMVTGPTNNVGGSIRIPKEIRLHTYLNGPGQVYLMLPNTNKDPNGLVWDLPQATGGGGFTFTAYAIEIIGGSGLIGFTLKVAP